MLLLLSLIKKFISSATEFWKKLPRRPTLNLIVKTMSKRSFVSVDVRHSYFFFYKTVQRTFLHNKIFLRFVVCRQHPHAPFKFFSWSWCSPLGKVSGAVHRARVQIVSGLGKAALTKTPPQQNLDGSLKITQTTVLASSMLMKTKTFVVFPSLSI